MIPKLIWCDIKDNGEYFTAVGTDIGPAIGDALFVSAAALNELLASHKTDGEARYISEGLRKLLEVRSES